MVSGVKLKHHLLSRYYESVSSSPFAKLLLLKFVRQVMAMCLHLECTFTESKGLSHEMMVGIVLVASPNDTQVQ